MKIIRNTGITIIVVVLAYLMLRQFQLLPDFKNWFRSKPVLIENSQLILQNIRDLKALTTIISFDEVVESKTTENTGTFLGNVIRNKSFNPKDRTITLIARGRIFAGIDLDKLKDNMLKIDKDTVSLQLPKGKILDAIVNPSDCEVFIEEGDWATVEINQIKVSARQNMINRALERKILEKAEIKAKTVLSNFLLGIGFKKVAVFF